jgi:hypothetical protein
MDPLTALSLAGSIVQFVDFGLKLLKDGRSLYKSSTGALQVNEELEFIINDLQTLIAKIRVGLSTGPALGPLTEEETVENYTFEGICDQCAKISKEIIDCLEKVKVKADEEDRVWESLKRAVRSGWKKRELSELTARLLSLREHLHGRILYSLRYV